MEEPLTTPRRFSKLPTYDTGTWRTAIVYAEALVAAAEKAGKTDEVVQEFDSFVDDVLEKLPKLEGVLTSGFVDEEVKEAMLNKALANSASPIFLSFLQVLSRHGRLDMLQLIHLTVHEEYDRVKNRMRVLVSTAEPLDAAAEQTITAEIKNRLNIQPILDKQF